jgi:hypothetical protein
MYVHNLRIGRSYCRGCCQPMVQQMPYIPLLPPCTLFAVLLSALVLLAGAGLPGVASMHMARRARQPAP